jgi:hypothetical protein
VIGVTSVFVVVTATPFKVSFPITLPSAATGVVCLKPMVLLVFLKYRHLMILPTHTVSVAVAII